MDRTAFSIETINELRQKAGQACPVTAEGPQDWSKSTAEPLKLLRVFDPYLRLQPGYTLCAYQYRAGGNGNGIIWAMPIGAGFPEPHECPTLEDRFLEPPKRPAAVDDLMEVIEGDGSPWSYLCASLFAREAAEFGSLWHGCSWSTHTILGADPWRTSATGEDRQSLTEPSQADKWRWLDSRPDDWSPIFRAENNGKYLISFYTFSALGQERIIRITDGYTPGTYRFTSDSETVATGGGRFVF